MKNIIGQGLEMVDGVTTWVIRASPDNRSYGAEVEAVVNPLDGLVIQGNATVLQGELGGGVDTLAERTGVDLALVPRSIGNLAATYSVPGSTYGLEFRADWHYVTKRFSEDAVTRPLDNPAVLPGYNYFNFGAGVEIPGGARLNVDLLNAFQSKGLEEGNPRLATAGGAPIFLARPLLPRRLQASITYDFGGARTPTQQQ